MVAEVRREPQMVSHQLSHLDPLAPPVEAVRHYLDIGIAVAEQAADRAHKEPKVPLLCAQEHFDDLIGADALLETKRFESEQLSF